MRRPKVLWVGEDKDRAILTAQMIRRIDTVALIPEQFQQAGQVRQQLAPNLPPDVVVQLPPTSVLVAALEWLWQRGPSSGQTLSSKWDWPDSPST